MSQGASGTGQPQAKGNGRDAQHNRGFGRCEPVEGGERDGLLVQRAEEWPGCGDVDAVGDQVRVLVSIGGTVTDFGQANRDGIVAVVTTLRVLEGLACHAEEPGARRRNVYRDVIETTPRDKHDVTDDVLSVGRMDAPADEAEEIEVRRIVDLAEALFALRRRRSDGIHVLFLSGIAQVCRSKTENPHEHPDLPLMVREAADEGTHLSS